MISLLTNEKMSNFNKILVCSNFDLTIEDDFTETYIYEDDGKIIGFINYSLIYDRIELNYIYVDLMYRKRNVATEMMNFLIDNAIKNNCYNITLEVRVNNIDAIKLYEKFGFKKVAIRKKYYKNIDAILMIRKFDNNENNIYIRY